MYTLPVPCPLHSQSNVVGFLISSTSYILRIRRKICEKERSQPFEDEATGPRYGGVHYLHERISNGQSDTKKTVCVRERKGKLK